MGKATRLYSVAFNLPNGADAALEVEEFISWVVTCEPTKYQLHFCLGLINYKAKGDYERAQQDFSEFLSNRKNGEFDNEAEVANEYLEEIESAVA